MDSFLVFLCIASLCGAPYVPYIDPQATNANNNNNSNNSNGTTSSLSTSSSGSNQPPMWSPFHWEATGSYSAIGTISNQIIYPSPPAPLMNPSGAFYYAIDVDNSVIKMNFTVGGMQKTNASGTWLTFAPGGECWLIPYWTYAVQLQAYTYATLKRNIADTSIYTGNIEDVSSCATTVATTLLTKKTRVYEWDFQGGFFTNLGSTNFDYQLLFNSFDNVVPQSNTTYWDVDPSCYPPNFVSTNFCPEVFPFGCSSFLQGYKPEGSSTPSC